MPGWMFWAVLHSCRLGVSMTALCEMRCHMFVWIVSLMARESACTQMRKQKARAEPVKEHKILLWSVEYCWVPTVKNLQSIHRQNFSKGIDSMKYFICQETRHMRKGAEGLWKCWRSGGTLNCLMQACCPLGYGFCFFFNPLLHNNVCTFQNS